MGRIIILKKVMTEELKEIEKDSDLKKKVESIYTSLEEAKEEIWRRWNDKELKKKVEDFLGGDIPEFLKEKPVAVLVRPVISPNFELMRFLKLAQKIDLDVLLLSFIEDKFVAKNTPKYNIARMFFHNGRGKRGGENIETWKILDFNNWEGKNLCNIKTIFGENLVDFHRRILQDSIVGLDFHDKIFDVSRWFKKNRNGQFYYLKYLSLFIAQGVLFENFLYNKEEEFFTREKVLPSFDKAVDIFNVKPLIVRLEPSDSEESKVWYHYPISIKQKIIEKNYGL